MYHSPTDSLVDVISSDNLKTSFDDNSKTNYELNRSTDYAHGYPEDNANLIPPESDINTKILSQEIWAVSDSGNIYVKGFVVTKKFSIWLGNGTVLEDGQNRSATIVYDTLNDSYTVNPLFSAGATSVEVKITQGAKSATQTISTQTEIIVT